MKYLFCPALIFAVIALGGCAHPPMMLGQPRAELVSEDVVVYFIDRPQCNFETVAYLQVDGGYFSLNSLLERMRQQAAEIGASGLYVLHTQRSELKDYRGSAKAIRCLSA